MRINIALSLAIGVGGLILAGASLPVDTQITHRTKLGDRTQPYWLVPEQSKMLKVRGGLGIVRLFGAIASATGFGLAMHFAGEDERQQEQFWFRQSALDAVSQKTEQTFAEIDASTELNKKQMEAQAEVDLFSLRLQQNFRDAIGYVPPQDYEQPALTHGKPGTLDEMTNPGDKVTDATLEAIEGDRTQDPRIPNLSWYPSVLIYGAPGSGKTHFAAEEIIKRQAAGHRVIVLDPHAAYGAWQGCEVIGGGMNHEAIDVKLAWFAGEVSRRYKRVQNEPNPQFEPLTFVCDEFTRWGSKVANSTEFFEQLVTDIRKVEMFGVIISHTRTLAGLANAKGFASLRDEAFLEIEILGEQGENGRATPKFEAMVKLPGGSLTDRTLVKLGRKTAPKDIVPGPLISISEKPSGTVGNVPPRDTETLGTHYGIGRTDLEALLLEVLSEASPPIFSADFPLQEHERCVQLAKLVIAQNLGKEKTILLLWGARPGGRNHALYTEARAMLERLIKGDNNYGDN